MRGSDAILWSALPEDAQPRRDPNAAPGDTKKLSRDHVVNVVNGGLVTIAGGKWTTYRQMAEDAVDKCLRENPELNDSVEVSCQPEIRRC